MLSDTKLFSDLIRASEHFLIVGFAVVAGTGVIQGWRKNPWLILSAFACGVAGGFLMSLASDNALSISLASVVAVFVGPNTILWAQNRTIWDVIDKWRDGTRGKDGSDKP